MLIDLADGDTDEEEESPQKRLSGVDFINEIPPRKVSMLDNFVCNLLEREGRVNECESKEGIEGNESVTTGSEIVLFNANSSVDLRSKEGLS